MKPIFSFDIAADGSAARLGELAETAPADPGEGVSLRWLHLDRADRATRAWITLNLPPVAARVLLQDETRPRCDRVGEGLILNLRGVNTNPGADIEDMVAVRLWATERLVVSTRTRRIYAAEEIARLCDAGNAPPRLGAFLAALTAALTDRIDSFAGEIEDRTDAIEDRLLDHSDVTEDLSPLRASAIKLHRFLSPQRAAVARLAEVPEPLIDAMSRESIVEVADRATRAVEGLESVAERLDALQDHAAAQMSQKLARQGNILSIVAAIFLPLSLLTGLFGVNLGGIPGTAAPWAFAALSLATLAIGVGLWLWFRRRDWM